MALTGHNLADGEPEFGRYRLPARLEALRSRANRLGPGVLSRRAISLARRICLLPVPGPVDVEVFGSCQVRLYPRSNRSEKRVFVGEQTWDFPERTILAELFANRPFGRPFVFVDAGANVGLYSLFLASRANRKSADLAIIAIEPDRTNFSRLKFNVTASRYQDMIRVVPVALGNSEYTGRLSAAEQNRGEVRLLSPGEAEREGEDVEVRTLTSVLSAHAIDAVDALKIDIEGAEYDVLSSFFESTPQSMWPGTIILEVGKTNTTPALDLCRKNGYGLVTRTTLNAVLRHHN